MRRLAPALLLTALLGGLLVPLGPGSSAAAAPADLPADVLAAVAKGPVDVLVSYDATSGAEVLRRSSVGSRPTEEAVDAAASTYAGAKAAAMDHADESAEVVQDFEHLPVQLVRADDRDALDDLAGAPGVASITLPRRYTVDATTNLEVINQPEVVATGATGEGTAVAILDTGINPSYSPGLYGNCDGGPGTGTCRIDFHENANAPTFNDVDPERHGSNVASVIATIAPQAHLIVYGVFVDTPQGLGTSSAIVLAALDDLVANAPSSYVRAVNLSLGAPDTLSNGTCTGSPFASVFSTMRAAGMIPVVASGNGAYDNASHTFQQGLPDPACAPGALSVGAVYTTAYSGVAAWGQDPDCIDSFPSFAQIMCFSQTSPQLSVLAPGFLIPGAGTTLSGTSQAAPHVAGAVALLFDSNPAATVAKVQEAITSTGPPIVDTRPNPDTAKPLLDIQAAHQRLAAADVPRIAGADRVATALVASQASFPSPDSAGAVVLASSQNFPDGLAGTPLAQAKSAPLLLTDPAVLPGNVLTEVQRVLPTGGTVYVLGGTAAIGEGVAQSLSGAGFAVQRLAGPDRYATAVAIADAIGSVGEVLLATGLNFPDALSAGVAAAHVGGAVLFTQDTTQAPATQAWLSAHSGVEVTIVGGTANGTSPGAVALVGADRYETAVKVADHFFSTPTTIGMASGTVFPDALSGGAHIARLGGPILLTPPTSLSSYPSSWLQARRLSVVRVYVYGGTAAVAGAVVDQIKAATT